MALTASFGLPEVRPSQEEAGEDAALPRLRLLLITKSVGGFRRESPVAAALSESELQAYLGRWLQYEANRAGYVSQRVLAVPFVTPLP
jgi:hypothetical protein